MDPITGRPVKVRESGRYRPFKLLVLAQTTREPWISRYRDGEWLYIEFTATAMAEELGTHIPIGKLEKYLVQLESQNYIRGFDSSIISGRTRLGFRMRLPCSYNWDDVPPTRTPGE